METQTTKPTGRPAAVGAAEGQLDLSEKGRGADGQSLSLDRRLFMQLMSFRNAPIAVWKEVFQRHNPQAILYQDTNDPTAVGVLTYCEDPAYIVDTIHPMLSTEGLEGVSIREKYTMLGRTYAIGYEPNLEEVLIQRPIQRVCNPETPWVVFYPLRRSGRFEQESREEQRKMLMEHGGIGQAFGKAGFATDIRLAGHGLNKDDNDFVVGLIGKELFPLSAVVQRMRKTRQTAEFIEHMGPFFVGRAIWQPASNQSDTLR